jgi:hypothetical protein
MYVYVIFYKSYALLFVVVYITFVVPTLLINFNRVGAN